MSAVQMLLNAMPDPSAELEFWRQLACEAYRDGCRAGWKLGYEQGARLRAAEWSSVVAPLNGLDHTELELRRWGPGGREHFGDPQPADRIRPLPHEGVA
jgi:hypothetical protein